MTAVTARPDTAMRTATWALVAGVVAAAVALVGNTIVAQVALALGVSDAFAPLAFATYGLLTVVGVVAGLVGWMVLRRTAKGAATLRWLVPTVLLLSFVPDVLLGFSGQPGVSWGGVAALMAMHVVVTVVAVATFSRLLPVRRSAA